MTKLFFRKGKYKVSRETEKPVIYLGKELEYIDYSETTAMSEFCEIKFKGESKSYLEQSYKIEVKL